MPSSTNTPSATPTQTPKTTPTTDSAELDLCPSTLSRVKTCLTPHALRVAYNIETLTEQGFSGKGQTIIDIVSYGSPTLQEDMDVFSRQFHLPAVTIQVIAPLGTVPFDPRNGDMAGWAEETELDVQIIHAIAPDAHIIVMTSPVDETEGTIGLPEFLKLEQYAVQHHLGQVFSQSYVASEATLEDKAGQALVQTYTNFYKQITTSGGWTVVSGSGDQGATDWADVAATHLADTPNVNFPADVPWVTSVGGTSLVRTSQGFAESAWPKSGGGFSKFFTAPDYQQQIPQSMKAGFAGHTSQRGIPDIAANADPATAMSIYINGNWHLVGGTSASTPLWAGVIAIANQMAGHPLGFINPAIYKLGTGPTAHADFRDITVGNNTAYTNSKTQVQGFTTMQGWDAVTGWGAPLADHFIPDLITALK
jgi:subtilase family serine protease